MIPGEPFPTTVRVDQARGIRVDADDLRIELRAGTVHLQGIRVAVYLGPPVALIGGAAVGGWPGALLGAAAWLLMAAAYGPTLRLYGQSPVGALLLPVAAVLYTLMTVDSALHHWRGQGGAWKGRAQGVAKGGQGHA